MKPVKNYLRGSLCALSFLAAAATPGFAQIGQPDGYANYNGTTTGGAGGATVTVSTLADLVTYLGDTVPRIVQISGTIQTTTSAVIAQSNKTIIGLGSDARIQGRLELSGSNFIVQNITFWQNVSSTAYDSLHIGPGERFWIDHCTFEDSGDDKLSWGDADWITVSWCKFHSPRSSLSDTPRGTFGPGSDCDTENIGKLHITMHHCYYAEIITQRMPWVRFGRVHIYNSYYNSVGNSYCIRSGRDAEAFIESNYFEEVNKPWQSDGNFVGSCDFSNALPGKIKAQNNVLVNIGPGSYPPGTDTVFTPPYSYTLDNANDVKTIVVAGAGVNGGGPPPPPPAAPSGLSATAVSSSEIDLAWTDNASNETGFKIERSTDGVNFTQINTVGANVTTYPDTGLSASTTYTYRVRAFNGGGDSAYSNTASATTQAPPPPPAAPSNLSATAISSTAIDLAWTDNSTNETGFKIERSTDGVNFTQINTVGANVTTYPDTGLSASTTYYYRVRATNGSGDSVYSNTASATTQAVSPPAAPSNLSATAVSSSAIDLAWTDNSTDEDGFKIERSTDGVNFAQINTVGANVTTYPDTGLSLNTTYTYRVRAFNGGGDSAYSNTASATTSATTTVTFTSVAADDGRVLESSETSNVGGTLDSTNTGPNALRIGDDNNKKQFKAFASFDTSSLPDGATIVSATLKLTRGHKQGTDPFTTHGSCFADIKGGTGFNGSTALEIADFQAAGDAAQVATMSQPLSDGALSTGTLNATGRGLINKTGKTQFRVYFSIDDDNDGGDDYIGFYSSENTSSAKWPVLEVTYQ